VLPESLPVEKRQARLRWKSANPLGALTLLRSHPELLGLTAVNFLGYVAHEVYAVVFVLYGTYRYAWSPRTIGSVLAVVGLASMVISAGVVGAAVKWIGERRALFLGLFLGALGFALFGLAPVGWMFVAAIPINNLWQLAGPTSQALMSRRVSPSEQGELQGALGSVRGIAMVVGPGLFSLTFAAFLAPERAVKVPGAPWYLAAVLLVLALAVAWAVLRRGASDSRDVATAEAG
jgi:MFS transporter, DHA1 family, tetracycline resistance protein